MYAPRDILACRLATTRTILGMSHATGNIIFRAVALLASLGYLGHIFVYAPRDILACCLAITRTILGMSHGRGNIIFRIVTLLASRYG